MIEMKLKIIYFFKTIFSSLSLIRMNKILSLIFLVVSQVSYSQNLLQGDVSAEADPEFMTSSWENPSFIPVKWDHENAYDGKSSIRITRDQVNRVLATRKLANPFNWRTGFDTPDLKQNTDYTISFYAKASQNDYPIKLRVCPNCGHPASSAGKIYNKNIILNRNLYQINWYLFFLIKVMI